MAETESPPPNAPQPAGQPLGPGVLMVFGLICLGVAAWCGWDAAHPKADWGEHSIAIWMNWGGAALFGLGAVYCFVLAAKRSKQGQAGAAGADSGKPPQAGA